LEGKWYGGSPSVVFASKGPGSILDPSEDGLRPHIRSSAMIHDLVLSLVFLSLVTAPAFVAMRADSGKHEI
jgi:hypothetical protein